MRKTPYSAAILDLKTNKIICAGLTIHNKADPAAVQTYDDEAISNIVCVTIKIKGQEKARRTVCGLNNVRGGVFEKHIDI